MFRTSTRLAIAGLTCAAALGVGVASSSATAQHAPAAALGVFDLGTAPFSIPANCPFTNENFGFQFLSGNAVEHEETNKNGDWGGDTIEGTAQFGVVGDDGSLTAWYQGRLTTWEGGGNNAGGQTEFGETFTFHGSSVGGSGTLDVHFHIHATTNDAGVLTANILGGTITCS